LGKIWGKIVVVYFKGIAPEFGLGAQFFTGTRIEERTFPYTEEFLFHDVSWL
jgi:hypothetical protein